MHTSGDTDCGSLVVAWTCGLATIRMIRWWSKSRLAKFLAIGETSVFYVTCPIGYLGGFRAKLELTLIGGVFPFPAWASVAVSHAPQYQHQAATSSSASRIWLPDAAEDNCGDDWTRTHDPLLAKPDRAASLPAKAANVAGCGHCGVVRECPLGTGQDRCEWHASGTASEGHLHGVMPSAPDRDAR